MKVIAQENICPFDVDSTLILPIDDNDYPGRSVQVLDPVTNNYIEMRAHEPNIRLLLEEKHRGSFILVWSRGGYEWAESVIKALNLQNKVDLVMSKPLVYFDDVAINEWLPYRVWLDPRVNYKKTKE